MSRLLIVDMGAAWGGQEIYSKSLTLHLLQRGWQVTQLSPHPRHIIDGCHHIPISIRYADFIRTAKLVSSLQAQNDVVHFNGIRAIYLSNLCRKSCAFVGTKHLPYATAGESDFRSNLAALASLGVFHNLDRVISISEATFEELPACVQRRSSVVLNGVEDFGEGHEYLSSSDILSLCFVGRFVEHKGIMRLLEAAYLLKEGGTQFHLLLAGGGPLERQARDYVASHNLGDVVSFLGFVEQPGDVFRKSHVCILPSLHEGLPLSLLEALSANCALVGHDIPGVADVIVSEYNGLFAPISAEGLAFALKRFADSTDFLDRIRRQARAAYEKNWRVERMVDETEAVYRQALSLISTRPLSCR